MNSRKLRWKEELYYSLIAEALYGPGCLNEYYLIISRPGNDLERELCSCAIAQAQFGLLPLVRREPTEEEARDKFTLVLGDDADKDLEVLYIKSLPVDKLGSKGLEILDEFRGCDNEVPKELIEEMGSLGQE